MGDKINKMLRVSRRLTQDLGRDPTYEMLQIVQRPLSLETQVDHETDLAASLRSVRRGIVYS